MAPVRLALIGFGAIGRRHAAAILKTPGCELVGIAAASEQRREQADAWRIPFFTDFCQMLDQVHAEGVIDATPSALRLEVVRAVAARELPLLVEKPIADTIETAQQLVDIARGASIKLLVGQHRRHNRLIAEAKRLVAAGDLGEVKLAAVLWLGQKPNAYYQEAWRAQPGGGPLITNLIHDIDTLRFILGDIDRVSAFASAKTRGLPFPDMLSISLRFQSGALGSIALADTVAAPWVFEMTSGEDPSYPRNGENQLFLAGTSASLALPQMALWRHPDGGGWRTTIERRFVEVEQAVPLESQIAHFCRVVRGEETPIVSGEDALMSLAVVTAITEAARVERAISPGDLVRRLAAPLKQDQGERV
jgi:predicted dehydrogenase